MTALLCVLLLAAPAAAEVLLTGTLAALPPGAQARGSAELRLRDDDTVDWELRVADLTGFAVETVVARAEDGAVVARLTDPPPTGVHVGTFGPLDAAARAALVAGGLVVRLATAAHPAGELGGPVTPARVEGTTCDCAAGTTASFRRCVRGAVRRLPPSRRRAPQLRAVVRAARRAVCGPDAARGTRGCCVAAAPEGNLVVERLCTDVPPRACLRAGGTPASGCRAAC